MAEVAQVRALLAGPDDPTPPRAAPRQATGPTAQGGRAAPSGVWPPSALDQVCRCFNLSSFERRALVLCAAPELDGRFADVLEVVQGSRDRAYPTFGLCLAAFPDAHWSALGPGAPLRHWRLVELGPGPLTAAPLRVDEWAFHVLTGTGGLDQRLAPLVVPLDDPGPLLATNERAAVSLAAAWRPEGTRMLVALRGSDREQLRLTFAGACARLGWLGCRMCGADVPLGAPERAELVRLWEREVALRPAALLVECVDAGEAGPGSAVERFVDRLSVPVAIALGDVGVTTGRALMTIEPASLTGAEQRALWAEALAGDGAFASLNGALDRVVSQFDLDAGAIRLAAHWAINDEARNGATGPREGDAWDRLWEACRHSARGGLEDLAQRLETTATFDDLILPAAQLEMLRNVLAHVRYRSRVYSDWQMAGPSRRGLGVSVLFAGASGTGKTLAAEVLANALALDLYRIDLSQVVSKYIGETEKNLRRIFEAATGSGAVLLFDEADALFGKRSEVRDSHDRYANVEISYLLQAMEAYRGLAVLTTNMRSALDSAFLRRLRFVITFPFPGPAERARIWQRAFPPATPTLGLDLTRLAQLAVAGGNIRMIALHAAFTAAEAGVPVGMAEVLQAAVAEYAKLERPLTDTEIVGWL